MIWYWRWVEHSTVWAENWPFPILIPLDTGTWCSCWSTITPWWQLNHWSEKKSIWSKDQLWWSQFTITSHPLHAVPDRLFIQKRSGTQPVKISSSPHPTHPRQHLYPHPPHLALLSVRVRVISSFNYFSIRSFEWYMIRLKDSWKIVMWVDSFVAWVGEYWCHPIDNSYRLLTAWSPPLFPSGPAVFIRVGDNMNGAKRNRSADLRWMMYTGKACYIGTSP